MLSFSFLHFLCLILNVINHPIWFYWQVNEKLTRKSQENAEIFFYNVLLLFQLIGKKNLFSILIEKYVWYVCMVSINQHHENNLIII